MSDFLVYFLSERKPHLLHKNFEEKKWGVILIFQVCENSILFYVRKASSIQPLTL